MNNVINENKRDIYRECVSKVMGEREEEIKLSAEKVINEKMMRMTKCIEKRRRNWKTL